jgi:hypothetical protein
MDFLSWRIDGSWRWPTSSGAPATITTSTGSIFEYIEIFHNRKRRHSALGMRTPIDFEKMHPYPSAVA